MDEASKLLEDMTIS
jgi:hypothetical protein